MWTDFIILRIGKRKKFTYLLTEIKKREIKLYFPVLTYLFTYLLKKFANVRNGICVSYVLRLTYLL